MIPDRLKKTVQIPFRVVKDKLEFFYGGALPTLKEGAIGEITIAEYSVMDKRKLKLISQEFEKDFLPEKTHLYAKFSKKSNNQSGLLKKIQTIDYQEGLFAEIVLTEPLRIKYRGTKKPELLDCKCKIPLLPDIEATSLNHAYTMVSEKIETHRKTHTGNIYTGIFFLSHQDTWRPLDDLRSSFYRDVEYQLSILCSDRWWLKKNEVDLGEKFTWAYLEQKEKQNFIVYCITEKSKIISENYFTNKDESITWLNSNQFKEFDPNNTSQDITQPYPPYKKNSGD